MITQQQDPLISSFFCCERGYLDFILLLSFFVSPLFYGVDLVLVLFSFFLLFFAAGCSRAY